jgi:hypothetical protein
VEPVLRKPETTGIRCALAGRIPYQTRAWFNGPWRLGLRAWSAVAACLLVVPAGAELGEPGREIRLRGTRLICLVAPRRVNRWAGAHSDDVVR